MVMAYPAKTSAHEDGANLTVSTVRMDRMQIAPATYSPL